MDVPLPPDALPPGHPPPELSFAEWVTYVFDNAADEDGVFAGSSFPPWDAPRAVSLAYLTRLFEDPAPALAPYSDAQINAGLWHIVSGPSDHVDALFDRALPLAARLRAVRAIATLHDALFAVRCTPHLSHLRRLSPGTGALNGVCYMWWDLLPYHPRPQDPARSPFDVACLDVMRHALALPHPACQESALHGLSHWMGAVPREAGAIVDGFLQRMGDAPEALQEYARWARSGMVQ